MTTSVSAAHEGQPGPDLTASPRLLSRLLRRPTAVGCLLYVAGIVAVGIIAPIVLPDVATDNAGDLADVRQGPSTDHLLGTDALGRDVLDRLLVGTRVTLLGVSEALIVATALGVPFGLLAGFAGGWIDRVVSWLADLAFSTPHIVIVLVVLAAFPQSLTAAMITFGALAAPGLMRVVRSATLPVREELYIAAARVAGLTRPYIVVRHVLPRVGGPIIVQISLIAASALLVHSGLAFLDLVVEAPAPSWGGMIADGVDVLYLHPWLIWPPGFAIALTIVAIGLLGDAVRDVTTERWSSPVHTARPKSSGATPAGQESPKKDGDVLLDIADLRVVLDSPSGPVSVLDGVSVDVAAGETVGLVGESGCGKTMTAMAILGLLPGNARIDGGRIDFNDVDLTALPERELRRIRGKQIGLVSQEPMVGLNPVFRVGWQLAEAVRQHHNLPRQMARERVRDLLASVHLPDPDAVARRYPHELSGGMAQRVAIARALAGEPRLLIADEPTTALDVTVQDEILGLLHDLRQERDMAILLVTHDWGVVADMCQRAVVMYAGEIVERGDIVPIFDEPLHPYTQALLESNPHDVEYGEMLPAIPGSVPKPGAWPSGCRFQPRCRYATPSCVERPIPLDEPIGGRQTRCIHPDKLYRVS